MYVIPDVFIPYPPSHLFYALDLYIDWSFCDIYCSHRRGEITHALQLLCASEEKCLTEEGTAV